MKAFVLGAGLGTRLRPLTSVLPKPLIPVWNKPLITWAFDHLLHIGVTDFVVNTHHLPECYDVAFPDGRYGDASITFAHEPELLETGGGIANIADLVRDDDFIVYNGDILTDLPLDHLRQAHRESGNLVTLVLRTGGDNCNVAWDQDTQRVQDLRNARGTNATDLVQFTGIYIVSPEFLPMVRPVKESVVPAWLELIEREQLGGILADKGQWWDLGNRESYLEASAAISTQAFPAYPTQQKPVRIHPDATIPATTVIDEQSTIASGVTLGNNVQIRNSILWPETRVGDGASLQNCILTGRQEVVKGQQTDKDL